MPRLSLYKPEKGPDYEFLDNQILEMFTVGGVDMHLHKLMGHSLSEAQIEDGVTNLDALSVQDMLFLENRDRSYEKDVYTIRCVYNVADLDFDLSQFGMFLANDTLFLTVHIRSTVKTLERKIIAGDVIELPALRDEYALNDSNYALKRYFVVEDVSRASQGYTQTWYPHLYRLKLKRLTDSQEFKDILDIENEDGTSVRDDNSVFDAEVFINNKIVEEAELNALLSGYDTAHFFTIQTDENGDIELLETNNDDILDDMRKPVKSGYKGYLLGDGLPPNGTPFGTGIYFPTNAEDGDYFLRTDYLPNRLFRYTTDRWNVMEDNVRLTLTNTNTRNTQKTSFINNTKTDVIAGDTVEERQSLSKALRPTED
jgi:hypothetical protein